MVQLSLSISEQTPSSSKRKRQKAESLHIWKYASTGKHKVATLRIAYGVGLRFSPNRILRRVATLNIIYSRESLLCSPSFRLKPESMINGK